MEEKKYLNKEGLSVVFEILKKELDKKATKKELPNYSTTSQYDELLERFEKLEYKVDGYNLVGSFEEGTSADKRYVYINGDKKLLDEKFKIKIDEPIANVNGSNSTSSLFSDSIKEIKIFPSTSEITNMSYMFRDCSVLKNIDLSSFDTSRVTTMYYMFGNCSEIKSLDLSTFNTSLLSNIGFMFNGCENLTSLDLSSFDTSLVSNMSNMFNGCKKLQSVKFGDNFKTSSVKDFQYMFADCNSLPTIDISSFDTSQATKMNGMFKSCKEITSLNLSKFNTSQVTEMGSLFDGCTNLLTIDVSSFNTSNVNTMSYMFSTCSVLTSIKFSNFDMSNVTSTTRMFNIDKNLTTVTGTITGIKVSLDLKSCPLTKESALVFLNGLAPVETTQTLTLSSDTFKLFTSAELAPYQELGWTIIGS